MRLEENTVLITGGSEGVGLALAEKLAERNTVIICGRSTAKLAAAKRSIPRLQTFACDLTDRWLLQGLMAQVIASHPELNILINNAGGRTRQLAIHWRTGVDLMGHALSVAWMANGHQRARTLIYQDS